MFNILGLRRQFCHWKGGSRKAVATVALLVTRVHGLFTYIYLFIKHIGRKAETKKIIKNR